MNAVGRNRVQTHTYMRMANNAAPVSTRAPRAAPAKRAAGRISRTTVSMRMNRHIGANRKLIRPQGTCELSKSRRLTRYAHGSQFNRGRPRLRTHDVLGKLQFPAPSVLLQIRAIDGVPEGVTASA